jgi:tetratricopeptide (TPR) repeat protein
MSEKNKQPPQLGVDRDQPPAATLVPIRPVGWQAPRQTGGAQAKTILTLPTRPAQAWELPSEEEDMAYRAAKMARERQSTLPTVQPSSHTRSAPPAAKKRSRSPAWRIFSILCIGLSFALGLTIGARRNPQPEPSPVSTPETFVAASEVEEKAINQALTLIRQNKIPAAFQILDALRAANPRLSSISYLTALAALQGGDFRAAAQEIALAQRSTEKASDAYALGATLENLQRGSGPEQGADERAQRAESLLRQAIAADQANPAPRLELGLQLRARGENEAALAMISSARLRLHPVDPAVTVDTTLLLIELEQKPTELLPTDLDPDKNTASLLGAAYVAMRQEDYASIIRLLKKARERLTPELYNHLIADPVFAPYRARPGLAGEF